jgi:hypothetical protein
MLILKFKYIFKCCQHKKVPNTTSALLLFNKYPQNSTQKNVCITRSPETVLRVLAFGSLGYRLGPQTLLALAKVPFLAQ